MKKKIMSSVLKFLSLRCLGDILNRQLVLDSEGKFGLEKKM